MSAFRASIDALVPASSPRFWLSLTGMLTGALQVGCPTTSVAPDAQSPVDTSVFADSSEPQDAANGDAGPTYPIDYACTAPCGIHWRELAPFDVPIDHHTTFIIDRADGPYLYVLGGIDPDASGSAPRAYNERISAAKIAEDGTLGPWEHHAFRYGLAFHAQTQYLAVEPPTTTIVMWSGGIIHPSDDPDLSPGASQYTFMAPFPMGSGPGLDDMFPGTGGNVATTEGTLSQPVLHGALHRRLRADGTRGDAFLIGGSAGSTLSNAARRYDDSEAWVNDAPLPGARSHHAAVEHDGHIYILGGFSGTTAAPVGEPSILRSTHDASAHITGWETVGTLEDPPWTAAAFIRENFVYVVGGGVSGGHHGGGEFIDQVRRAPIMADGSIGTFVELNGHLPVARAHVHQTPVHGNFIYSVGGRIPEGSSVRAQNRIFVGTFD